jgi:hypothetical protein
VDELNIWLCSFGFVFCIVVLVWLSGVIRDFEADQKRWHAESERRLAQLHAMVEPCEPKDPDSAVYCKINPANYESMWWN